MAGNPRVMKRHGSAEPATHVAFNFEDVRERCENYRDEIRQQCRDMLAAAQAEADQLRDRARADGQNEGYRNGLRKAEQEIAERSQAQAAKLVTQRLQTVLPAVQSLIDELVVARRKCQADWETELVNLSVAISEKIIRRQILVEPDSLLDVVSGAVDLVTGGTSLELHLNSVDLESLGDRVRGLVSDSSRGMEVRLVADESVQRGGCVVVTDHGAIDARIETMLQRISEELLESVAASSPASGMELEDRDAADGSDRSAQRSPIPD